MIANFLTKVYSGFEWVMICLGLLAVLGVWAWSAYICGVAFYRAL